MGSSVDQFRAAPIFPVFGVFAEGVKELAATTYRKWADGDDSINIPLKLPSFFGCKLGMSRKIYFLASKLSGPNGGWIFGDLVKCPGFQGNPWSNENAHLISAISLPGAGHRY